MIKVKNNMNWKPLSVLATSLILSACGGGGGSSDPVAPAPGPANSPAVTPVTPTPTGTTITGAITKGPVSGATVELFQVDQFGNATGALVATTTTGADGSFTVTADTTNNLLVVTRGGVFKDESDQSGQREITLAETDTFLSILPQGSTSVAVTPFTTALVLRGRLLGGPDGTFADKFATARSELSTQAGFDIVTTIPADPVAPDATASAASRQYALLLGGIANLVNNVAIQSGAAAPTYDMVVAVTFDLVDGQFDGQYFGDTNVPGSGATPVSLPQNLDFNAEVNRFRNNNASVYEGVTLPTVEVTSFLNTAPTSLAAGPASVRQGAPAQLDGSGTTDAESGVFYSWTQTAGTPVTLSSATVESPTFTAPQRLIGNETLTFELTATDPLGLVSVSSVGVPVVGALPTEFYVVDDGEVTDFIGVDIEGGGLITLTDATNGTLLSDLGPFPFTYTVAGNELALNFATPFPQDDFDEERDVTGDGVTDGFFLVEENVDQFIFTLITDNLNGDALDIAAVGQTVVKPLDDPAAAPLLTEPLNDPGGDLITAFDSAQAVPFQNLAGTRRTLFFNSGSRIATLSEPNEVIDELFSEVFAFVDGSSGTLRDSGEPFTYTINPDGSLDVVFGNGDRAKYINLLSRPAGDIVAVEYTLQTPFFPDESPIVVDVIQSLAENTSVAKPTAAAPLDVAGVYSGRFFDDNIPEGANLDLRLNPDGTGSVNFEVSGNTFLLFDFPDVFSFQSSSGVCWEVAGNGDIIVNRALSLNVAYSSSSETDPTFCANLTEETTDFQYILTLFDREGSSYRFFDKSLINRCAFTPTADCADQPGLIDVTGLQLRLSERVPLTATPPVAALDPVQTPEATAITIDLLANDIARDNPIDPASVIIGPGPFQGVITTPYDPATGQLTYTPNPGTRRDLIQYTVADTQGNRSPFGDAFIDINPCASIDGVQGFFDDFSGDCSYDGFGTPLVAATNDVDLGSLPNGGVHRFLDPLVIGADFSSDSTAAGITVGGQGPSLNIAEGAVLAFDFDASLSINRGSQINVGGTPTNPVVMTSFADIDNQRIIEGGGPGFLEYNTTGGWGGVEINGFGITNGCGYSGTVAGGDLALLGECHLLNESGLGHYGGINNGDSSGAINYLQVKYTGAIIGSGHLNGLTLNAVGSNTSIQNIQIYSAYENGIEMFGGAASMTNVAVLYAMWNSIGYNSGYSGDISNALLIQDQFTGRFCVDATGRAKAGVLSPGDIDNLILQGIGFAKISNLTCVLSASTFEANFGGGLRFSGGAFGQVSDSVVTMVGQNDFTPFNNPCVSINEDLNALQESNLDITSTLFACTDTTSGNQLADSTPTESFLSAAGNQFATLSSQTILPPPVTSAGEGVNLLEGSPLIFSPAPASLLLDGSAPLVTPTSSFFGAVQQSNDWTQGWTFGLRDGARIEPLWYELPIVFTATFVPTSKNQLVTLDASVSTSLTPPLSYQWNQLGGPTIVFSNPTGASTTFTAPGAGTNLSQGGRVDVELVITDAAGLTKFTDIEVVTEPAIPAEFYAVTQFKIPFQFLRDIGGAQRISIDLTNNTGNYKSRSGSFPFTWFDSPTQFVMDFTGAGGISVAPTTSFEDVDMDLTQEEITRSGTIDQIAYTLVSEAGVKKIFSVAETGIEQTFNVTDNVPLPDEIFTDRVGQNVDKVVVDINNGLQFELDDGQVTTLLADVSGNVPTLQNPGILVPDELTFNADGTGFARLKNSGFNWFTGGFGNRLDVSFNDGDFAEYVNLFEGDLGDAVAVTYTKSDSSVIVDSGPAITDEPVINWSNQPFVAGIYETNEAVELDDGSFVDSTLFYRLHPDGTGQLEIEIIDPATGLLDLINISSNGICWVLDGVSNKLTWSRVLVPNELFSGSKIPSPSTCLSPLPESLNFKRDLFLYDTNLSGQLRTYTENRVNPDCCGDPMALNVPELTDAFIRNFEQVTPFIGNPPIAVDDLGTGNEGTLIGVAVLDNDLAGDSGLALGSVTIVIPPKEGVATVDASTGNILYTPNVGHSGSDFLQYRVQDTNGNQSTIGRVDFTVSPVSTP
jgi:hypothetical protein